MLSSRPCVAPYMSKAQSVCVCVCLLQRTVWTEYLMTAVCFFHHLCMFVLDFEQTNLCTLAMICDWKRLGRLSSMCCLQRVCLRVCVCVGSLYLGMDVHVWMCVHS